MHETKNDLPQNIRTASCERLQKLLWNTVDLRSHVKQAHWTVRGENFMSLHKLFDELSGDVTEYEDLLGERIQQLGGHTAGTIQEAARGSKLPSYPLEISDWRQHCEALSTSLSAFGKEIRQGIDAFSELRDMDSSDLCTEISRGTDKWLWFVESHLSRGR